MMSTIGMAMRFRKMKKYILKGAVILPVKYLAVPAVTFLFAITAGLGKIDNGLLLKIVLILSLMPTAALAMIPPAIYDLDIDLANTAWFISMIFMIITVPALNILISFI